MSSVAALLGRTFSPGEPAGLSRLAALAFFLLALAGAAAALFEPQTARWAGVALLTVVGAAAAFLLIAAWPRATAGLEEARRGAAAAASSNVAWAVTAKDGSVLDCNVAYRLLAGAGEGEPPTPPQLAFPGEGPAAALYRLSRAANEGRAREENFETESGQKLTAAVRALKGGETAWWFTPRLPEAAPPKGTLEKRTPSPLIRFSDFFRNAPMGVAVTEADGRIVEANSVFAEFFALASCGAGARLENLVTEAERAGAIALIALAARGEVSHEPVE